MFRTIRALTELGADPSRSELRDYFRALQIPLLSGRTFEPGDDTDGPKVVITTDRS